MDKSVKIVDKQAVARILEEIGTLLELKGENPFKSRAYHKAARAVRAAGATILRGGAFKPRPSPYSFRGLEEQGLKLLAQAREETGLPVSTEAVSQATGEAVARDGLRIANLDGSIERHRPRQPPGEQRRAPRHQQRAQPERPHSTRP